MRVHRPLGPRPTRLESDVLKLRALEMVLVLFYVEDLRKFILGSLRSTDQIFGTKRLAEKKVLQSAFQVLVEDKVLTIDESRDVQDLFDYRNTIAHAMHKVTSDVGAFADAQTASSYDGSALQKILSYRKKISDGMARSFVLSSSFSALQFDAAERTYIHEINRLRTRVINGVRSLKREIDLINQNIAEIPAEIVALAKPRHPNQHKGNGALSKSGVECCYVLFSNRATPIAVAHIMHISLRSAKLWERRWKEGWSQTAVARSA